MDVLVVSSSSSNNQTKGFDDTHGLDTVVAAPSMGCRYAPVGGFDVFRVKGGLIVWSNHTSPNPHH